jgi:ribosome-associated protein
VDDDRVSKTRRKKDMHALQDLGATLVTLGAAELARLDLPERLADAIAQAKDIKSFEAKRRQMQYIGRLMREVDAVPIAEHVASLRNDRNRERARQHQIEAWRDRLIEDDKSLFELARIVLELDTQHMHALIRNARRELAQGKPPRAARALFRELRQLLDHAEGGRVSGDSSGDAAPR